MSGDIWWYLVVYGAIWWYLEPGDDADSSLYEADGDESDRLVQRREEKRGEERRDELAALRPRGDDAEDALRLCL